MKRVRAYIKETSWGSVYVEVDDNATEDEIIEVAEEKYNLGLSDWDEADFEIYSIDEEE